MPSWLLPAALRVLGKWSPLKGSWELFSCQAPWNLFQVQTRLHGRNKSGPISSVKSWRWDGLSDRDVFFMVLCSCNKNTCSVAQRLIFNGIPEEPFESQNPMEGILKLHQHSWQLTRGRRLQVDGVGEGAGLAELHSGFLFVWVWQREKVRGLNAWGDCWHSMTSCKSTVWILVWQTTPLTEIGGWIWE